MQRLLLSFLFCILNIPVFAQQQPLRSDTLNFSVQLRYLLISYGGGIEFPFRQHSFGLQAGYNYVPIEGNIHLGFNEDKVLSLEYKRYLNNARVVGRQIYLGTYLLYKITEHDSPHEREYSEDWTESSTVAIGPLIGYKWYQGKNFYLEAFGGLHAGKRWGELRTDLRDETSGSLNTTFRSDSEISYGIRLGLSAGIHPFKMK